MAELTPIAPADRQIIESYGGNRFRVSGQLYEGSIIVRPDRTVLWPIRSFAELSQQSFQPLMAPEGTVDLLLLGCGPRMCLMPPELRQMLRTAGIVLETMDTGAACRTYNVLLAEERRVAAALIAVD